MGWVSPTGHSDPGEEWGWEYRAYDDDTNTYAYRSLTPGYTWTSFLELTLGAAISCNKVRCWVLLGSDRGDIDVDVYYAADWHHAYEGAAVNLDWKEITLDGTYDITKARFRQHNDGSGAVEMRLYEFEFWEVPPAVGRSFGFIFG